VTKPKYDITTVDPNENPPSLEEIHWEDHSSWAPWRSLRDHVESAKEIVVVWSVGRIIYEDKKIIALAPTISPNGGTAQSVLTILKTDIVDRFPLTKKRIKK
jgi:hypothetical protein